MIPASGYEGREVAVVGLGAAGLAAARALAAGGAAVTCWDDRDAARAEAARDGAAVVDPDAWPWSDLAALVLAPGVPLYGPRAHPIAARARAAGVEIIGDIDLFAQALGDAPDYLRPKVIAITGTNGKSTTTALIGHIVKACGFDAQVGGNIGLPALSLEPFHPGAVYVLEVSSFQLDLTARLRPDVAVILNISPDHLDRHGDMAAYIAAKKRILQRQEGEDTAVIGVDDAEVQAIATEIGAHGAQRLIRISANAVLARGVHAVGGVLYDAIDDAVERVCDLRAASALLGRHNWQNAAAAYAVARAIGLERREIADALMSFAGLVHRMEEVARAGAVRFINDSKATNPNAARQALAAFENVYWIAGGRAKGGGYEDLWGLMARVSKAYLIGEAAVPLAAQLRGRTIVEICRDLDAAVRAAARDAAASSRADPVVLLSPACASFDQFANFERRGEAFREAVLALDGVTKTAREPEWA